MKNPPFVVITTIFKPTEAIRQLVKLEKYKVIVVGDLKTPSGWSFDGVVYLSPERQKSMDFNIIKGLPWNHYSRKMIGYLYAIKMGAESIIDIDDDTIPYSRWGCVPTGKYRLAKSPGAFNVYRAFSKEMIWPRGFPLEAILKKNKKPLKRDGLAKNSVPVWQFLINGDTDVDAIYRLTKNKHVYFRKDDPVVLSPGTYCPFNSQNTFFSKETFPLMYLPAFVNFRFTDILRGLVAQPIMWADNYQLGFTPPTAKQKRNPHNYLEDFESEIPCYLQTTKIINLISDNTRKGETISENLLRAYKELGKNGVVEKRELFLLQSWLKDLEKLKK